jgi:hypothetical protein
MHAITDTLANAAAAAMTLATAAPARLLFGLVLAGGLLIGIHVGIRHLVEGQAATSAQVAQLAR